MLVSYPYVESIDGKRFNTISRRTETLFEDIEKDKIFYGWCHDFLDDTKDKQSVFYGLHKEVLNDVKRLFERITFSTDYSSHTSHFSGPVHKRVLRSLLKTGLYVVGGLAGLKLLSPASAQPSTEIGEMPVLVELDEGNYINGNGFTFVHERHEPLKGTRISINGWNGGNVSGILYPGESLEYGFKQTADYDKVCPDLIVTSFGHDNNVSGNFTGKFLMSQSLSCELINVYTTASILSQLSYSNMTLEQKQNYTLLLNTLKQDIESSKQIMNWNNEIFSSSVNAAVIDEVSRYTAMKFALSGESVFGNEYRIYNKFGLNETSILNMMIQVHDKGIGAIKDDIEERNITDADHVHSKLMLYQDMSGVIQNKLNVASILVSDAQMALSRENTVDISGIMDSLIKELYPDQYDLQKSFDEAYDRFQQRESAIGNIPFRSEVQVSQQNNNDEASPLWNYAVPGFATLVALGVGGHLTYNYLRRRKLR